MALSESWWVTRVPLTLSLSQKLLISCDPDEVQQLGSGYWGREYEQSYGGVKQRWLVVFSEAAYLRECKTFQRRLSKAQTQAQTALTKLSLQTFACQQDAQKALHGATNCAMNHHRLLFVGILIDVESAKPFRQCKINLSCP